MCTNVPTSAAMEITHEYMTSAMKTPSFMLEACIARFESVLRSREHGFVSRRTREHAAQSRKRAASSRRRPVYKPRPPATVVPATAGEDRRVLGEAGARAPTAGAAEDLHQVGEAGACAPTAEAAWTAATPRRRRRRNKKRQVSASAEDSPPAPQDSPPSPGPMEHLTTSAPSTPTPRTTTHRTTPPTNTPSPEHLLLPPPVLHHAPHNSAQHNSFYTEPYTLEDFKARRHPYKTTTGEPISYEEFEPRYRTFMGFIHDTIGSYGRDPDTRTIRTTMPPAGPDYALHLTSNLCIICAGKRRE